MKCRAILAILALGILLASAGPGWAKVRDSIVVRLVSDRSPIEAIILARLERSDGAAAIVVERSYLGRLKPGDKLPLQNSRAFTGCTRGGSSTDQGDAPSRPFVLFLSAARPGHGSSYRLDSDWSLDPMVSKCLTDGRLRHWIGGPAKQENLTALERRIEVGLAARATWERAWAASDPEERLDLLRPFLTPADGTYMAHYDVSALMDRMLKRLDRSDPRTREFVESLLALPHFQKSYGPQGTWRNFGAGRRQQMLRFLDQPE